MFELMDNYNAKEKLISMSGGYDSYDVGTLAIESYNILIGGTSTIITLSDMDIYYDTTTMNVILVDWRTNRQGAPQ